jgi:hypothetical protein
MSTDDKKFLEFGKMVFGMVTDCLVEGGTAHARLKVTFPLNQQRTAKGAVELFVTTDPAIADLFEKVVSEAYAVTDVAVSEKVQ